MMKDLEKAFDNMINPKPKELDISKLIVQMHKEYAQHISDKPEIEIRDEINVGQSLMGLMNGTNWDSLLGLYGIDFNDYFVMDDLNKVKSFRIDEFNKRILEIENEKRWHASHIHTQICKLKEIESLKECKALEIGSGTGVMANWMSDKVNLLHCLDINPQLIQYCKEFNKDKNNIEYHLIEDSIDLTHIKNIDFVYSQAVFIHLGVIDFYVYLKELYKSLNKGGIIYIDIIDGDLDSFNFEEVEMKRQATALKTFYKDGTSFLFTINSSTILTKVAKELGYELILKDQMNSDIPNVTLAFKKS